MTGGRNASLLERFEEKFSRGAPGECWEWQAGRISPGYGSLRYLNKHYLAHRVSYELYVGEIPAGLHIRHKCDNRRCVNPAHLEPGTNQDNINDCKSRGRSGRLWQKVNAADLVAIREEMNRPDRRLMREIATEYGVSRSLVSMIASGKRRIVPTCDRRLPSPQ